MAGPISSFYAQVGINTRIQDLRKVDRYLKLVETKLKRFDKLFSKNFSLGISSFFVNERNLKRTLGNALDKASKDVVFEVSRFAVNERNLRAAMLRAGRSFAREAIPYQPSIQRSTATTQRERNQLADKSGRNFMYGGGTAGALARYGFGSVPFLGGAYGLMSLNTANQEAISTRLTTQAVLQAQGMTEQQGREAFSWLRNLANVNGFSYMQAAPDYNQFLSNSLGAGVSLGGSQDIFKGFSEYQTAMGVTPARRKLVNNALSQMLGKGTISMEELRRQMAESMPGTMSIFAEALAQQTGSGLTGQGALAALYEAVPTGKLKAADLLPIVAQIMSKRAEPKIGALRKTSMAEQARLGNSLQDMVNTFSKSGGEEGFARFFRTTTTAVERLTPVVRALSESFNWLSKQLELPITLLGDLGYHFGNIKTTLDNLNPNIVKFAALGGLMMTKWGRIGAVFSGLFLILEDISVGIMGGESLTGKFFTFLEKFVEFDKGIMGVAMSFLAVAAALKIMSVAGAGALGGLGGGKAGGSSGGIGKLLLALGATGAVAGGTVLGLDEIGFFDRMEQYKLAQNTPEKKAYYMEQKKAGAWNTIDDYLAMQKDRKAALAADVEAGIITPEQAMSQMGMTTNNSNTITNTFEINIDGVLDPAGLSDVMTNQIMPQFEVFFNNQLQNVDISFGGK